MGKLISEILSINEDEFDIIADVASNKTESRDARDILLAALSQAKSLTSLVNSNLKLTEQDLVSRSVPDREALFCPGGSQLVQITTSMNHHLTDLLALMQEKREMLRKELSKCQELSDQRPNSLLSFSSDNCVVDTDEETSFEACPVPPRVQPDVDLTPTEETAPASDVEQIIVTSSPSKVSEADGDSKSGDERRFCLRNSLQREWTPDHEGELKVV